MKIKFLINLREWPGLLLISSFVRAPMLMCDLGSWGDAELVVNLVSKVILSFRHQLTDQIRLARG